MKKTILIVGITSFVGSNLAEVLNEKYKVVGTYYDQPSLIPGHYPMVKMDVNNKDEIKKVIYFFRPDYVVYAIGLSSLTEAKEKPREAEALNSKGAINCLNAAERSGALFIYLSSAFVLSGENKLYKESDTPFPMTTYGSTVANAEFLIQRSSLHYLILRCPVLYGLSYSDKKINILELIQKSIFEKSSLKLDDRVIVGFLDVQLVARFLMVLLEKNIVNRLLHLSSKDHLTFFQFAQRYAQTFKTSSTTFEATTSAFPSESNTENVPLAFKMDVSNAELRIGIKMPSIQESLDFTLKRFSAKNS